LAKWVNIYALLAWLECKMKVKRKQNGCSIDVKREILNVFAFSQAMIYVLGATPSLMAGKNAVSADVIDVYLRDLRLASALGNKNQIHGRGIWLAHWSVSLAQCAAIISNEALLCALYQANPCEI